MVEIVALYQGKTVNSAELLAVSSDPALVNMVTSELLQLRQESKAVLFTPQSHQSRLMQEEGATHEH